MYKEFARIEFSHVASENLAESSFGLGWCSPGVFVSYFKQKATYRSSRPPTTAPLACQMQISFVNVKLAMCF